MPRPRKPSKIRPLKTMRIFCEGAKTEPAYIKAYLVSVGHDERRAVIEIEKTRKNTAVQLVAEAIDKKKSASAMPDDEIWVVYDRESVAKYSHDMHAKAYNRAQRSGINVALTNVCFEYWLLLHLVNTAAPYGSYDDLLSTSPFRREFKKVTGFDYSKADVAVFELLNGGLAQARERAARINNQGLAIAALGAETPYQINPYVGMVELLDAIDQFA